MAGLNIAMPQIGTQGWSMSATPVLQVSADYSSAMGYRDPKKFRGETNQWLVDSAVISVNKGGAFLVSRVKQKLARGTGIGASGRAAENVSLREARANSGVGSEVFSEVVEGSYVGNFFIREGRRPVQKNSNVAGRTPAQSVWDSSPPVSEIIQWIAAKGIAVKQPSKQKTWRYTKYGGERADRRNKPGRLFKRDMRAVALVIARFIGMRGLTWLKKKYPHGKPFYDYYGEFFKLYKIESDGILLNSTKNSLGFYYRFLSTGTHVRQKPVREIGDFK